MKTDSTFGTRRIYYNNFAEHLLNAYNPNMTYPDLPHRWSDDDWRACVDMVAAFGYTVFEFWLVPRLFCRDGLASPFGREFARQIDVIGEHAHRRGLKLEVICGLATVGSDWHTLCPHLSDERREIFSLTTRRARRRPLQRRYLLHHDPAAQPAHPLHGGPIVHPPRRRPGRHGRRFSGRRTRPRRTRTRAAAPAVRGGARLGQLPGEIVCSKK